MAKDTPPGWPELWAAATELDWATQKFLGLAWADWAAGLMITGAGLLVTLLVRGFLLSHFSRLGARGQVPYAVLERVTPLFLVLLALYAGAISLKLPASARDIINTVFFLAVLLQATRLVIFGFIAWTRYREQATYEHDPARQTAYNVLRVFGQIGIVTLAVLLGLDNLGFDITALVAGLGIGGVAVAFALQAVLGDIFASISILLDKPFVVGDFVDIGGFQGNVEKVGIKTTHLRSLSGEQIIIANNDLLQSRIRNFKRMEERRVLCQLGLTYDTTAAQLELAVQTIKEIIAEEKTLRLERVHFFRFGAFSLDIELAYHVVTPAYKDMMDAQQKVNLEILRRFAAAGLKFAFPTQTVHIETAGKAAEHPGF